MSDQYSGPTQQPDYSPPPPPDSYGPDAFGQPPAPPGSTPSAPKKTKPAVIVAIVLAVLLLCCCAPTCVGAIYLNQAGIDVGEISDLSDIAEEITEDITDDSTESATEDSADSTDDYQMNEWLSWTPSYSAAALDFAPSDKISMVEESVSIAAPDFNATDDIVWYEGYYSADEEWYYADTFLVRITHPSTDDVSAAVWIYLQSDLMIEDDIPFYVEAGDVSVYLSNDVEMLYTPMWSSDGYFDINANDNEDLWVQIGEDWPGALVTDIYSTYGDSNAFTVDLTTWEAYAIEDYSPGWMVDYSLSSNGTWIIDYYYEYTTDSY